MRKFSKSKKAAILASIMGGWMIGGSAFAANLLITVPSNYGASNMTAITGSRVTDKVDSKANVAVIESLNKDPGTYSFVLDGKSMFLLRQYNYSTVDLIPSKVIGADTTWSKDGVYPSGIITKGANPHSAAGHNGYIYVGDYDLGTIGVVKYDKNVLTEEVSKSRNLMEDLNTYCGMSYSSPGWVHGEGMVVKNGQLYVVVSINPKGGYDPYDDSIIMQYQIKDDGSLEYVNYTCSARNPDSVKLNNYNDILLHTGIGGYQYVGHGNSESAITLATINNNVLNQESKSVVLPENVKSNGLDFRDMTVWPNGTAYILAYNLATGGGGSNLKVYKTTVANLSSDNPVDWEIVVEGSTEGGGNTGVGTGWFNKLFAEYYTKRVWGEFGNNIVVYTDGAVKPTYTWSAYELAGNTSYHTFNSVSLLSGDTVFGNKALLTTSREEGLTSPSVTTTKIVNINANSKTGDYFQRISGTDADSSVYSGVSSDNSVYTFTADKTISLKPNAWKTQADLSNNILAAVYAHDGNDVTVNAGSNTLQLQVQNSVATPVGVYAGNGKNITINAGKLNIITIGAVNGNSLNNAIMNDAGKSAASKITVNGDVNISMNGSYGGNGVAVQKTDRWGEASYASDVANTITINGNLTIKGSDSETWGIPINADNVLSRFNNAGILTQVENSRVDVSGTADMDVYGNGITTNAKNSTVSVGGGEINVPKGMNYGYYTLGAYQGTINVNTGKDGTAAGNNSVKLGGDIFALKTGTVNVALTTDDSYLRGIVDNGGTVNMWLQNGASWINQANNTRYAQDNEDVGSNGLSHLTKLIGGSSSREGIIFQKNDSKDITVDNYSGSTMLIYSHDSKSPTSILGGNFTVGNAAAGSAITLRTDSSGINMGSDDDKNAVLNALANKLYYTGYTNGENNLSGYAQLAEGLTAASESVFFGNIKYSSVDGQGSLDGSGEGAKPEMPSGNNSEGNKHFLVNDDIWNGSNSGDNVNLALKDKASWTGNNSGSNMVVNATDSAWTGDNKGAGTNVTLNASDWNGKNDGSKAVVTLKNKASWTGDSSGSDLQLTLDNSAYQGNIRGDRSSVTLNNGSSWSGNVIGSGSTLNMHGDSLWQLKGDNVLDSFNTGSISKMRKAAAVAAGGGTTVDMTDATAGNLTINKYNGKATFVYQHDVNDVTKINGGDITIGTATTGSGITLLTDSNGLETTNKYAINDALNALANKLYYTGYLKGEKNLDGYVKIAEGLTSASATKFAGNIGYDSKTGQGSLDKATVDYGTSIPNVQSKTDFKTTVTGDYVTDKEYRDAGVLSDTDNIYNFTKDATTITTDSSAITTAKDTTLKLNSYDLTITANGGDGIATTSGTLTVQDAGNLTVKGAKAINANNSKVDITAVNATLNGDVSTNNVVNIKATKAAKLNGAVSASGANAAVSINGTDSVAISGAVSADGANAAVTIDSADTTIGSDVTANGNGAKVTAKNIGKLDGNVATDADGSVELNFKEGASWSGDNSGNTTMSLSKGTWNGANTGKLNATLTNGTTWTGDSSGAGSTIKLDGSSWSGMNSGTNANVTLTNGASWSKGNTADGVTVKADKSTWTGANGGAKANITLSNSASWTGTNTGNDATISLTDSSWSGDNSGAGLSLTANNSKWNGSTSAAGSATLTNGSIWNGASTSADFALTLNGSTWNNSGASSLKSFNGTNGIVDMTNAAASVTIGSYSGDATVIYKHNSSNPGEVYGGNFTVTKAASNSKITMLTDRSGVDFSDEDSIANALNSLANKLYYTGYITGERNLTGYVKLAEGLTASSVVKQTGDIAYDKTTGQGSLKDGSVTPNVTYPEEQTKDNFTSQITGEWKQDKEYKLAGVLHTDNAVYNFSKDRSIITTAGTSVGAGRDLQLQLNNKSMSLNSDADAVKADAITVEFKNFDKLDIKATGQALLAENGGKIILHNTGAVTADSAFIANGAGSSIKADGLTNITVGSGDAVKADAGSIELAGGTVKGNVTADNKGKISINANNNAAGSILTDITGNVLATAGSSVDIGLGTADSKLTGDVSTAGDAVINIYADMGIWTGNADGDNVNLHLNSSKAQWNNIGNSKLRSLKGNGGIINQTDANAGNIDVGDYSGNVVVNYKHTADKDTASNTLNNIKFGGGSLNIDKAAEGSSITLRTDNSDNLSYTETDNIEKLFRELSKKLYYADAGSNPDNLSGHVEIAEGLTKVKVYGDINYGEHGQGNYKDGSIKRTDPEIIYGSSETAMMRGAKSAMASTALLWRSENSDMLQRMGDVRLANEESGLWARYYGGKNSFDAKNTKYSTSFNAYQLGYDKQLDNNKLFGAAVSYNKGKNTYEMGGHGDGKAVSLSVYGSWNSDKGHYADVIVKGGKLDNDYTVYNDMGHKLEGDYDTWGLSLSAEYGRRMQMQNGFYIDPSVQFTVGRVAGADYSAASDFLDSKGLKKDMYVSQDAFTSAIGRIGLGMGKTTDKAMFYTKFALAHEFSGDFTTTFAAENEPTSSTAVDFGGTWFEWQLGGSMKVNDNSYVYATFEKKFGGDTGSNDWRLDAGLRWSF